MYDVGAGVYDVGAAVYHVGAVVYDARAAVYDVGPALYAVTMWALLCHGWWLTRGIMVTLTLHWRLIFFSFEVKIAKEAAARLSIRRFKKRESDGGSGRWDGDRLMWARGLWDGCWIWGLGDGRLDAACGHGVWGMADAGWGVGVGDWRMGDGRGQWAGDGDGWGMRCDGMRGSAGASGVQATLDIRKIKIPKKTDSRFPPLLLWHGEHE